ncbi:MAG: integrase catalytic domain-containing protein, partial [Sphingobacterium sp.]
QERIQGLFKSHPIPEVFDTVYMDLWQCNYNGKNYTVLTLIDQCTKWSECIELLDKRASTVAATLLQSWIYRFGVPRVVMSDNDPSFCNEVLDCISARFGITRLTSTPYHPEGNAVIESFHRTLSTGLRYLDQKVVPFNEALGLVLFGYRATPHSTTGHSPSFLVYGIDPRLTPDGDWRREQSPLLQERFKFLSTLWLDVQLQAQNALNRQNMQKNEARKPVFFEDGQLVLCRLLPLEQLRYKSAFYKAVPRWTLPHRVLRTLPSLRSAIVRCLITGKTRQVHIQDVQFIDPPRGDVQQEEWADLVHKEIKSMFDPEQCNLIIKAFFEAIAEPQRQLGTPPTKRARP